MSLNVQNKKGGVKQKHNQVKNMRYNYVVGKELHFRTLCNK